MSSHPVPNTVFWECYKPCNLSDMPHSIIHSDFEGMATLNIVVNNHKEASEAGAVLQEYIDDYGDDEIFFISPYLAPENVEKYIQFVRGDMVELDRQKKEEGSAK
jgi:hypothetical protein